MKARVDSAVKPAHSFFDLCIRARVVAAALAIIKLNSIDGIFVDLSLADASKASKRKYLQELASQVVDGYVLNIDQNKELANRIMETKGKPRVERIPMSVMTCWPTKKLLWNMVFC